MDRIEKLDPSSFLKVHDLKLFMISSSRKIASVIMLGCITDNNRNITIKKGEIWIRLKETATVEGKERASGRRRAVPLTFTVLQSTVEEPLPSLFDDTLTISVHLQMSSQCSSCLHF